MLHAYSEKKKRKFNIMYITIADPAGRKLSYDCSSDAILSDTGQISLWHLQDGAISTVVRDKMYLDISKMMLVPEPIVSDISGWITNIFAQANPDETVIDPTRYDWKYESNAVMMPNSTANFFPTGALALSDYSVKNKFSHRFKVGIDPETGWIQVRSLGEGKLKLKCYAFAPSGKKVKTTLKVISRYDASGADLVVEKGDVIYTEQRVSPYIFVMSPKTANAPTALVATGFDKSDLDMNPVQDRAFQATYQKVGVYNITFTATFPATSKLGANPVSTTLTYIVLPNGSLSPGNTNFGYTGNDYPCVIAAPIARFPAGLNYAPFFSYFITNKLSNGLLLNRTTGEIRGRCPEHDSSDYVVFVTENNATATIELKNWKLPVNESTDALLPTVESTISELNTGSAFTLSPSIVHSLYSDHEINGYMP